MTEPITSRDVTAADHLPECGVTRYPICICDRLRACEQRVRDERNIAWSKEWDKAWDDGMEVGTVSALDAAREALADWYVQNRDEMTWPDALAVIDALRGDR